eukprot:s2435_g12.t1
MQSGRVDVVGPWVRVWYIHLFLSRHVQDQIIQLWHDVIVPDVPTSIDVVHPSPLLADLILAQAVGGTLVAALVTVRPVDPSSGPRVYSGAVAFGAAVDQATVLEGIALTQVCQQRTCEVRHGRVVFSRAAFHQMLPGHGFVVSLGHLRSVAAGSSSSSRRAPEHCNTAHELHPTFPTDAPVSQQRNAVLSQSCPNQSGDPLSSAVTARPAAGRIACLPPPLVVIPPFVHAMLQGLPEDFLTGRLENSGLHSATVIHHQHLQRTRLSRCLQLTGPPATWRAQSCAVWFDRLVPLEAIAIDLAQPNPMISMPSSHAADQRTGPADQQITSRPARTTSGPAADQRTSEPADQRTSATDQQPTGAPADQRTSGSADQADQTVRRTRRIRG